MASDSSSSSSSSGSSCPDAARRKLFDDSDRADKILVFARLRPHQDSPYTTEDNKLCFMEEARGNAKKLSYYFNKIFGADDSQLEVFNSSILPAVKGFFHGQDALLFSYGTTSSGKTFTVQGTSGNPGIIPRSILTVLLNVEKYIVPDPHQCPFYHNRLVTLDPLDVVAMEEKKSSMLYHVMQNEEDSDCGFDVANTSLSQVPITYLSEELVPAIIKIRVNKKYKYSVWISYYEIYQEGIYDLLDSSPHEISKGGSVKVPKVPLPLGQDPKSKYYYIKGLKHYYVENWIEALNLFRFGRKRLSLNSTLFNFLSSRSHSVFTIKLVAQPISESGQPIISCLSICDLAGCERTKKTLTLGKSLKEANNINKSIMVLNRCFEVLRENQKRKNKMVVPYRESKLTKIFQKSLLSGDSLRMIVNLSQDPNLIEETRHVLSVSAICQEVKLAEPKKFLPVNPRVSLCLFGKTNAGTSIDAVSLSQFNQDNSDAELTTQVMGASGSTAGKASEKSLLKEKDLLISKLTNERMAYEQEALSLRTLVQDLKEEMLNAVETRNQTIAELENNIAILNARLAIFEEQQAVEAMSETGDEEEEVKRERPEPRLTLFISLPEDSASSKEEVVLNQESGFSKKEVAHCSTFTEGPSQIEKEKTATGKKWNLRSRKEERRHSPSPVESSSEDDDYIPVTKPRRACPKPPKIVVDHLGPPQTTKVVKKRGKRQLYYEDDATFEVTDDLMGLNIKGPVVSPRSELNRPK